MVTLYIGQRVRLIKNTGFHPAMWDQPGTIVELVDLPNAVEVKVLMDNVRRHDIGLLDEPDVQIKAWCYRTEIEPIHDTLSEKW